MTTPPPMPKTPDNTPATNPIAMKRTVDGSITHLEGKNGEFKKTAFTRNSLESAGTLQLLSPGDSGAARPGRTDRRFSADGDRSVSCQHFVTSAGTPPSDFGRQPETGFVRFLSLI